MIGIIGYGNIGKTIVKGLNKSDPSLAKQILVSNDNEKFYEIHKKSELFIYH